MTEERDIEEIRRKRLQELQNQIDESNPDAELQQTKNEQEEQQNREEAIRKHILRQVLTEDARKRLSNVRLVDEEKATQVEQTLIHLSQQDKLPGKVTDEQVKKILKEVKDEQEFNIKGMRSRRKNDNE